MGMSRAAGSPVRWRMMKTTREIPTSTKMEWKNRFKMYPFISSNTALNGASAWV
jgi:hypothetical protein